MATLEGVTAKLKGSIQKLADIEIPAKTGIPNGDGTFTLKVDGVDNQIWIRLDGNENQPVPCYSSKQPQSNVDVKVKKEVKGNNEVVYTLLRVDLPLATGVYGAAATQYDAPQTYDELTTATVSAQRLLPGRVRLYQEGTLTVWIEPFHYLHQDTPKFWPGGTLDLTANVPATANMQRWVKVGVDPATNTAVAENGAEYPVMLTLPQDLLADILFTNNIPCEGIVLKNGQTAITDFRAFADCRIWIWQTQAGGGGGMTSFSLAADSGTPEAIADGNILTVAGGTDIDTSVAPTDTVTVAASPRLSAAASLFLYETYFNFS